MTTILRDLDIFGNGGPPGRGPHHPDDIQVGMREAGERRTLAKILDADASKDAAAWARVAKESGVSISEIADATGATRQTVYVWLKG